MTDWDGAEWERELERLMWTDTMGLGPERPRRDVTTVELPHWPDDDALGW